jgi:hypothetical protein
LGELGGNELLVVLRELAIKVRYQIGSIGFAQSLLICRHASGAQTPKKQPSPPQKFAVHNSAVTKFNTGSIARMREGPLPECQTSMGPSCRAHCETP